MKQIFTRTQAVSVLAQVRNGSKNVNLFASIDAKDKLFKLSNEQLLAKLCDILNEDEIADVVDEVEFS